MNDNRKYVYGKNSVSKRVEFEVVRKWVDQNSKVIDLGSGDGTLLKILKVNKNIKEFGIEIASSGVETAKRKRIKSKVGRIDIKLPFKKNEFDYAICNVTLICVMYPEVLLSEMKRISKKQIITFPNFAFILNRLDLALNGVMPRFMMPGYKWYSTGQIHQLSIRDFEGFCKKNNFKILKTEHIGLGRFLKSISKLLVKINPNLFATLGVLMLEEGP